MYNHPLEFHRDISLVSILILISKTCKHYNITHFIFVGTVCFYNKNKIMIKGHQLTTTKNYTSSCMFIENKINKSNNL